MYTSSLNKTLIYALVLLGMSLLLTTYIAVAGNKTDPSTAGSAKVEVDAKNKVMVIKIEGAISRRILGKLAKAIARVNSDATPFGLVVLLNSKGGDGGAAIKMGQLIRDAQGHTFVVGECSSACTFVLAGGVVRGALPGTVGVHQGRLTKSNAAAKILKEVTVDGDPKLEKILQQFETQAKGYLQDMGIHSDFFVFMQEIDSDAIHWMNKQELERFHVTGFEPNYLGTIAAAYKEAGGPWPTSHQQVIERTEKAVEGCVSNGMIQEEFSRCYQSYLTHS